MDILVNIQSLHPPVTGIGRYTAEILNCLMREHHVQGFDITNSYSSSKLAKKLSTVNEIGSESNSSVQSRTLLKKLINRLPYGHKLREVIQHKANQSQLKKCADFIYWEPNYILQPFDGISVPTIHDLSYFHLQEYQTPGGLKWLEANLESSVEKASAIVAVSEFSKNEILKNFSVKDSDIHVVSPSVVDDFKADISLENLEILRRKYKLPQNYILSVGTLEPRKNISSLLEAFTTLPKSLRQHYPLVLVGSKGWGGVANDIQQMVDRNEVIVLGYIPQADIAGIYRMADLFVYISLYEGYGMPVAEAMASQVAVITSENSSMSEVSQHTAAQVNPLDIEQISHELQHYLEDKQARQTMVTNYQPIVESWSWQNSADKLNALFSQLK